MSNHGVELYHEDRAGTRSVGVRGSSVVAALVLLTASQALAQWDRGTITGLVTDASGGAVLSAEIGVVNTANNLTLRFPTRRATTGWWASRSEPTKLSVSVSGFQGFRWLDVQVQTNQTSNLDIRLQVGAVTETVTVTGSSIPLISTETMEVGMVVESKRFLDLP